MEPASPVALTTIGLVGGFLAGLLGLGGGVIIIPLLVYGAGLPVKLATGVSVIQALFAAASGVTIHRKHRSVDTRLGLVLGVTGVIGGAVGSFGSAAITGRALLFTYSCLVLAAIALLFFAPRNEQPRPAPVDIWRAAPIGLGVGVLAGILGLGGGFIIAPLLISVLKISHQGGSGYIPADDNPHHLQRHCRQVAHRADRPPDCAFRRCRIHRRSPNGR